MGRVASVPTAVSSDMAALADLWEANGRKYDETKHRTILAKIAQGQHIDTESADYVIWRKAEQWLVQSTAAVLAEPFRSEGDVIFKYHVIDMHRSWRPVGNWIWAWKPCEVVGREAEHFGVAINPFWDKTPSPFASIDGDRDSPRWDLIALWRKLGAPTSIVEAYHLARLPQGSTRLRTQSIQTPMSYGAVISPVSGPNDSPRYRGITDLRPEFAFCDDAMDACGVSRPAISRVVGTPEVSLPARSLSAPLDCRLKDPRNGPPIIVSDNRLPATQPHPGSILTLAELGDGGG